MGAGRPLNGALLAGGGWGGHGHGRDTDTGGVCPGHRRVVCVCVCPQFFGEKLLQVSREGPPTVPRRLRFRLFIIYFT